MKLVLQFLFSSLDAGCASKKTWFFPQSRGHLGSFDCGPGSNPGVWFPPEQSRFTTRECWAATDSDSDSRLSEPLSQGVAYKAVGGKSHKSVTGRLGISLQSRAGRQPLLGLGSTACTDCPFTWRRARERGSEGGEGEGDRDRDRDREREREKGLSLNISL